MSALGSDLYTPLTGNPRAGYNSLAQASHEEVLSIKMLHVGRYICKRGTPRRNEGKVSYRTCRSAGSVLSHIHERISKVGSITNEVNYMYLHVGMYIN